MTGAILFFDTETTGLYNFSLPQNHESQPHIVQLAAMLTDDQGGALASINWIVNPGVEIPEAAASVHGITTEKAREFGVPTAFALSQFRWLARMATLLVAHNIKFDKAVIGTAERRYWAEDAVFRVLRVGDPATLADGQAIGDRLYCTMEAATPLVNIPPTPRMRAAGFNKPKPPKLEECIKHFFGEELKGAHDAMIDVQACARVYFHIKNMG